MASSTQINLDKSKVLDSFIMKNNHSFSSAYAFNLKPFIQEKDLKIFNEINPEVRNSNLTKIGRTKLIRFINNTGISDTIQNFTLPNQKGELVSLSEIKSKYILLDFWASWCAPCIKENAGINEYYSGFDKKDFQIVGISIDKDHEKWLNALKAGQIQWTSLIDSELVINDRLGVISYPTNFLLDTNYIVIDKNLSSDKLKNRLIQLLE